MTIQATTPLREFTLITDNGCIRFGRKKVIELDTPTREPIQLELGFDKNEATKA